VSDRAGEWRPGKRPVRNLLLSFLLLGVFILGCTESPVPLLATRHVIFISIDTARADHFGFMGSPDVLTPHLDSLATESIVFTDYMSVVPTTLASHVSLLTGKYPMHHGTPRNGFMVNRDNQMLPELLKAAGYHTVGFAGSFSLDTRFDFAQGFDHYDEDFSVLVGEEGADQNQRPAKAVTDAVIAYLEETGIPENLFLFVHYFDPHLPYAPPAPFDTIYDPQGRRNLRPIGLLKQLGVPLSEPMMRQVQRHTLQYAGEITYADSQIGVLLDYLRSKGVLDQAILVITSDHGECMWEHGEEFDHGFGVYQATIHTICMIRLPGAESGARTIDQLTASIDIMPSVLDYLGLPVPSDVDGEAVDLRQLAEPLPSRVRFSQGSKPWAEVETDPRWTNMLKSRCIRDGSYKLIQTPYLGTEELYNVVEDPAETSDLLLNADPEIEVLSERLRLDLEAWASTADPLPSRFEPSQMEETVQRLKSLGYLR